MLDGFGFAETVPFTRIHVIDMRYPAAFQRSSHFIRLAAGNNHILFTLKDNYGVLYTVEEKCR